MELQEGHHKIDNFRISDFETSIFYTLSKQNPGLSALADRAYIFIIVYMKLQKTQELEFRLTKPYIR